MGRWSVLLVLALALLATGCSRIPLLQRPTQDFRELRREAVAGDPESQYRVGLSYTTGHGVRQDLEEGMRWFERAAAHNQLAAIYQIGLAYYTGRGVEQDPVEGVRWLKKAADQGFAAAQYQLGDAYMNGRGVDKERAWAARWFGEAASQDYAAAQFNLGVSLAAGLGLPVDREEAMTWLLLAEAGGYPQATEVRAKVAEQLTAEAQDRAVSRAKRFTPVLGEPNVLDLPTARFIQHALNELGFKAGPVDGDLGPMSRRAIGAYWRARGMPDTEEPTPALLERLRDELSERQFEL